MSTDGPAGGQNPDHGPVGPAPQLPSSPPPVVDLKDEKELEEMVHWASANGVALLFDFYADWCQPCKKLTPKLEQLATRSGGRCVLVKVDVDTHTGISDQLRIQTLPTVMTMIDGRFVDTFQGVLPDDQLEAFVDRHCRPIIGNITHAHSPWTHRLTLLSAQISVHEERVPR